MEDKNKTRFIRKNGKVIPIRGGKKPGSAPSRRKKKQKTLSGKQTRKRIGKRAASVGTLGALIGGASSVFAGGAPSIKSMAIRAAIGGTIGAAAGASGVLAREKRKRKRNSTGF